MKLSRQELVLCYDILTQMEESSRQDGTYACVTKLSIPEMLRLAEVRGKLGRMILQENTSSLNAIPATESV